MSYQSPVALVHKENAAMITKNRVKTLPGEVFIALLPCRREQVRRGEKSQLDSASGTLLCEGQMVRVALST